MGWPEVRTEVASILGDVSNIGVVHSYFRWGKDRQFFENNFQSGSKISMFQIHRRSATETQTGLGGTGGAFNQLLQVEIEGFYSVDDSAESQKAFDLLVDGILAEFREHYTLNGSALNTNPANLEASDFITVGNTLCHHCVIMLPVYIRFTT